MTTEELREEINKLHDQTRDLLQQRANSAGNLPKIRRLSVQISRNRKRAEELRQILIIR